MSKTDLVLKIIMILNANPSAWINKDYLLSIMGKSRSQNYKLLAELLKPNLECDRPAVLVEHNGKIRLSAIYARTTNFGHLTLPSLTTGIRYVCSNGMKMSES